MNQAQSRFREKTSYSNKITKVMVQFKLNYNTKYNSKIRFI